MGDAEVDYVGYVLDLVAAEWFKSDALDWTDMRRRYLAAAAAADTPGCRHLVVEALLAELGDGHSHLVRPDRAAAAVGRVPASPEGWMRGRAACIAVPSFMRNPHVGREAFAGRLQALLAGLDAERPAGWILDLRRNGGGDMWPMLAGLGPLLGEGPFGAFVAARSFPWTYRDGAAFNGRRLMCRSEGAPAALRDAGSRVAVLVGPETASAGEAVAIAFARRPDTLFFGQPTAGQSTANSSHALSDGAILALTAAVMADRTGAVYGGPVEPDVAVSAADGPATDEALDRAGAWLTAA